MFCEDLQNPSGVLISPGGVKAESHLFFIRFHAVNGQLPSVDGAGNGNGLRNEGGDTFDEGNDAHKKESGFDKLDAQIGFEIFRFPISFYPALYEMDEIF